MHKGFCRSDACVRPRPRPNGPLRVSQLALLQEAFSSLQQRAPCERHLFGGVSGFRESRAVFLLGEHRAVPSKISSLLWVRATLRAGRRWLRQLAQLRAETTLWWDHMGSLRPVERTPVRHAGGLHRPVVRRGSAHRSHGDLLVLQAEGISGTHSCFPSHVCHSVLLCSATSCYVPLRPATSRYVLLRPASSYFILLRFTSSLFIFFASEHTSNTKEGLAVSLFKHPCKSVVHVGLICSVSSTVPGKSCCPLGHVADTL